MIEKISDKKFISRHKKYVNEAVRDLQLDMYRVTGIIVKNRIKMSLFGMNITEIHYEEVK